MTAALWVLAGLALAGIAVVAYMLITRTGAAMLLAPLASAADNYSEGEHAHESAHSDASQ